MLDVGLLKLSNSLTSLCLTKPMNNRLSIKRAFIKSGRVEAEGVQVFLRMFSGFVPCFFMVMV